MDNALASCYAVIDDHRRAGSHHSSPTEAALSLYAQTSAGERGRDVAIDVPQTTGDSW